MNQNDPIKATFWMLGAIGAFTSMAIAGRELSATLDTFEIMLFRSLIGIGVVLAFATVFKTRNQISTRLIGLHFLRNVSHFFGQNMWFYAIAIAPLAQVFALEFSMPIWAMFLAIFVLKEKLTPMRVFTAFVGFVGILIVTQPWQTGFSPGVLAAMAAAAGFAGSAVLTRLLTRSVTITCILFWLTVMQAAFGLITAGYDGDIALPTPETWPWVVVISLAGLVAHFCLTKALTLAPAAVVVPVDFMRLPLIAIIGMIFYDEPLQIGVVVGAVIIFGANYANILTETRANAAANKATLRNDVA